MEKYLVPQKSSRENPKNPNLRNRWKRSVVELSGRYDAKYRHDMSGLLMQSYNEICVFQHRLHLDLAIGGAMRRKYGVSAMEFDTTGTYLVAVTKCGCLTVYAFDTLYSETSFTLPDSKESVCTRVMHITLNQQLDAVRWNRFNLDEVACTSRKSNEVQIFDINFLSSEPVYVLETRQDINVMGSQVNKGLCDIASSETDWPRVIASDTHGMINVWDRRMGGLPCRELTTDSRSPLNSIQLHVEDQIIFASGKQGSIYAWDLRGGRSSSAFQSHKEVSHPPLTSLKLAPMLEKIGSLKAQSNIVPQEIHSIDLDPSSPYQLAFHLDNGWSGVLNIHNLQVTHVHCPPPAWLNGPNNSAYQLHLRKASWLSKKSIYVIGSSSDNGIHLLDFYPDSSSPCHVDYKEDVSERNCRGKQNRFIPVSESITACAAHPFNDIIIAGTKDSSLSVVSEEFHSVSDTECKQ